MDVLEKRKKRLIYRATYRGRRELDILMTRFANNNVMSMAEDELNVFEQLLDHTEVEIFSWFFEDQTAPKEIQSLIQKISEFKIHA